MENVLPSHMATKLVTHLSSLATQHTCRAWGSLVPDDAAGGAAKNANRSPQM